MTALYELAAEYRADAEKLADMDLDEQTLADTLEVQVDTVIHVCTAGFFDDRGVIPLPRAWRNDSWHRFGGRFGFFNAAGTHFHTVMRADVGTGQILWALSTIDAEDP